MGERLIDQLLFGYDEGHRLLRGSTLVSSDTLSKLLGATDARPGSDDDRLLTGLPLPEERSYALCGTWAAPEMPRPGAVWAHVLLLTHEQMMEEFDPDAILAILRRPTENALSFFDEPVTLTSSIRRAELPPRTLLEDAIAAAYDPDTPSFVVSHSLKAGELALATLWLHQWPSLRMRFSFRTRDAFRTSATHADLVIARRTKGSRPTVDLKPVPWATSLAEDIARPQPDGVVQFLNAYGPYDQPSPSAVGPLAGIFALVQKGLIDSVRQGLEERYPTPDDGSKIKVDLFGLGPSRWWTPNEIELTMSVLSTSTDAWDYHALRVPDRLDKIMRSSGGSLVVGVLPKKLTKSAQEAVISALSRRRRASDVSLFASSHLGVALALVRAHPELAVDPVAWKGLTPAAARSLLKVLDPPIPQALAAATTAGHAPAAAHVVGHVGLLRALLGVGALRPALKLVRKSNWGRHAAQSGDPTLMLLAASAPGTAMSADVLETLEDQRGNPDEVWLRAATQALAVDNLDQGAVLRVVFGPLHQAITTDQMPHDCWATLDGVLPEAPDPALRLRRYLLQVAQDQGWDESMFSAALRDAGPYASELIREFDHDDDWWAMVTRAVLRSLGLSR